MGGGPRPAYATRAGRSTDLVDQGLSYDEAGKRLGISQSAVSQRAQAAGLVEGRRAREVVTHLAARLLGKDGLTMENTSLPAFVLA